jgi:bacillithiol system protein YtxJ
MYTRTWNGIRHFYRKTGMQFTHLETGEQLKQIAGANSPQVILKHNTTCSISKGVLDRLQKEGRLIDGLETIYVLDLLAHRDLSDTVAGRFGIPHRSPQLLLINDGRCVYHEWGFDISAAEIADAIRKQALA